MISRARQHPRDRGLPRDSFALFVDLDFIEIAHSWSRHRGQVFVESRRKSPARANGLGANINIGELNPLLRPPDRAAGWYHYLLGACLDTLQLSNREEIHTKDLGVTP